MSRFFLIKLILLLLILSFSCKRGENIMNSEEQIVFVGKLNNLKPLSLKNPSEVMLEDKYLYQISDWGLKEFYIHTKNENLLKDYNGKIVMIKGYLKTDLNNIIVKKKRAPDDYGELESSMQIRSDWVSDFTGFSVGRSTKEKLKNVQYIELIEIEAFEASEFIKNENEVSVLFKNIFETELNNIDIIAHYETRSYGKPQPKYVVEKIEKISNNEKITVRFNNNIEENYDNKKVLYDIESVEIKLDQDYLKIDLIEYLNY